MKNTSFILAYCLLIICNIFNVYSKLAFAEATPAPIVTSTPAQLLPTVSTGEATFDYSTYILTLTGTVNAHGLPTTVWFQYGNASGSYSSTTSTQTISGTSDTAVNISVNIGGLPPNGSGIIFYYYRIAAKNDVGTSYGEEKNIELVTPIIDCLCAVSGRVTNAVSKKGIGKATVSSFEGQIRYTNTSGYYTWNNGIIPCNFGGTYDLTASAEGYISLTQSIHIEPCIEGTLNFELQPITTLTPTVTPTPPWMITEDATNITSSSATLNATVPLVVGYVYFEYGTASGSYTSSVNAVREDTSDKVSANISGLLPSTTYYDRVVVFEKPPGGYTYGNEKSFTTLAVTPTVTPTPVCEAESIEASPKTLKLHREESGDVTVTVTGSEGCPVIGKTVTAKIKFGKKRISISPQITGTDVNGQAIFAITATKKTGNAKIKFEAASGLKAIVTVNVRRE